MTPTIDLFKQGGLTMYPLLALSVFLWLIVAWRYFRLRTNGDSPYELTCAAIDAFDANGRAGAKRIVSNRRGHFAQLLNAWFDGDEELNAAILIERARTEVMPSNGVLQALIQIAPLLGLLGTVMGMVQTFDVMAELGAATPGALSMGIAQALITTQSGLSVALAAIFGATIVGDMEKKRLHAIDRAGLLLSGIERTKK